MKKRLTNLLEGKSGFTLIELLVVLGVLGVIGGVTVLNVGGFIGAGTEEAYLLEQRAVQTAVVAYQSEGGSVDAPFMVCPGDKGVLAPYLLRDLQYCWLVTEHGRVVAGSLIPPLFYSDFEDMDWLNVLQGNWYVEDGMLRPSGPGENRLLVDGGPWDDFRLSVMASYLAGGASNPGGYGIYYRASDEGGLNGYVFQYDAGFGNGEFIVRAVVNGSERHPPIQRIDMAQVMGQQWVDNNLNDPHRVEIEVRGDRHVITVDGVVVLDFDHDRFSSGSVGFRNWHGADVEFDEIEVNE